MKYFTNFPLQNYNTFRLKATATEAWFPETDIDLKKLIKELRGLSYDIISGGSNIILLPVVDRLICLKLMPKKIYKQYNYIVVSANYPLHKLVIEMAKYNKSGIEGLIGIPGTVGGAIYGNSGSGLYSIGQKLNLLYVLTQKGNYKLCFKNDLKFSRRQSFLQDTKDIVVNAVFELDNETSFISMKKYKKTRKQISNLPSAGGIYINWHSLLPYENKIKGFGIGGAKISDKVNIIVNTGNATAQDVLKLINLTQEIIDKPLQLEVKVIGHF